MYLSTRNYSLSWLSNEIFDGGESDRTSPSNILVKTCSKKKTFLPKTNLIVENRFWLHSRLAHSLLSFTKSKTSTFITREVEFADILLGKKLFTNS